MRLNGAEIGYRSWVKSITDVLASACAVLGVPDTEDTLDLGERLGDVSRIAMLLVDGMGYELLAQAAPHAPFLADVVAGRLGHLEELTCAFPSTTPTNLVSLGTGALPGEHGILGFTVNVPGSDQLLNHVRWRDDPDPSLWQPVPTLLDRALVAGVLPATVARRTFKGSGLTLAAYGNALFTGADNAEELARGITAQFERGAQLVYGYHPDLDSAAHQFGIASDQWRQAAAGVDKLIDQILASLPQDAALIVTADHGGLDSSPQSRFDVGTDDRLSAGVRLVAGEPRVRYLHTVDGAQEDVADAWREVLTGRADILTRDEVIESGVFGPVRPGHRARIGDVVAICTGDTAVMATGYEPAEVADLIGLHGGLTPAETRTPLIVLTNP